MVNEIKLREEGGVRRAEATVEFREVPTWSNDGFPGRVDGS